MALCLSKLSYEAFLLVCSSFAPRVFGQYTTVFSNDYTDCSLVYDGSIVAVKLAKLARDFLSDLRGVFPFVVVGECPIEMRINHDWVGVSAGL